MYCAYHGEDHPAETPFNTEHIIPFAVGGSNQFTIQVCSKINSDFGAQIDSRFQNIFPVAHARFIRNIKSYSGEEPRILFRGTTELSGKTMRIDYEITQSQKNLVLIPSVQKGELKQGIRYRVHTTPAHFQQMLRDIERKRPAAQILDESGDVVKIPDLLAKAESIVPLIAISWDVDDWGIAAKREFVKIALGTAHFLLGEPYSRTDSAGQLRRFLIASDEEIPLIPIHGKAWPSEVGPGLQFLYQGVSPDQHLIALLHSDERLTVFINLFAEMRALIQIAEDPIACGLVRANDGFILTIDPNTRVFTKRTFEQFLSALSHG